MVIVSLVDFLEMKSSLNYSLKVRFKHGLDGSVEKLARAAELQLNAAYAAVCSLNVYLCSELYFQL